MPPSNAEDNINKWLQEVRTSGIIMYVISVKDSVCIFYDNYMDTFPGQIDAAMKDTTASGPLSGQQKLPI